MTWIIELKQWMLTQVGEFKVAMKRFQEKPLWTLALVVIALVIGYFLGIRAGILWFLFLSFVAFEWDTRVTGLFALVCLVSCPILLAFNQSDAAETMAVYAYYFLVMTIVLQLIELKRHPERFPEPEEEPEVVVEVKPVVKKVLLEKEPIVHMEGDAVTTKTATASAWLFRYSEWIFGGVLALLVLFVLGRLLLPGYILTLDMVSVPSLSQIRFSEGGFINALPLKTLIYVLNLLSPGWLVQKLVLVGLFFCLPFFSFRYLLKRQSPQFARCWVAVFYTVNPMVYTRFIAGQWHQLIAYALLPWVLHQSLVVAGLREPLAQKREWVDPLLLGVALAAVFVFSLHIGVMAFLFSLAILVFSPLKKQPQVWITRVATVLGVLIMCTSYWTVSYLTNQSGGILSQFDQRHWEAYRTASDAHLGTVVNVLALHGFWAEAKPWADQFLWPQDHFGWFVLAGGWIVFMIVLGLVVTIRDDKKKRIGWLLIATLVMATVFACGLGESNFYNFNLWLFNHIGFWRGFRDTQKWSVLIALVYAYFGGRGLSAILNRKDLRMWVRTFSVVAGIVSVLGYSWPMLGGFWGQVSPVWYPDSWQQANAIVKETPNCKALFLPWHQYLMYGFTNKILVANPAREFFDCEMITSRHVELESIDIQSVPDPAYDAIDGIVTGRDDWEPGRAIEILRQAGIDYILRSNDMAEAELWDYGFLNATSLSSQELGKDFTVYRLNSSTSTP